MMESMAARIRVGRMGLAFCFVVGNVSKDAVDDTDDLGGKSGTSDFTRAIIGRLDD